MTNHIPQTFINDLIARTDIVEIVEARVKISKKGQNYLGLCPFHNEKTPSFTVSAQKQFYYCFGCAAHGNAIGFLMAYDHMEFVDAIAHLSAKLGLSIPESSKSKAPNFENHFELLQKASLFFQAQLRESQLAINYLKSRGVTGAIAKEFRLGYAPDQWDALITHVAAGSNNISKLIQCGLVIQKDHNKTYDRFRNRIMYPIQDHRGRTIAFGARSLDDQHPKYLNSPETVLFHKNQELYGLYEVLKHNHRPQNILITEGYMDTIALHQFGMKNALATLGTATNPKHLQKLFRYTNEVIFCFDGDDAGRNAAWRALTVNLPFMRDGIQLRFMFLPKNDDPDSLIRRIGKSGFEQRLKQAKPLSQVFFELIKQEAPLSSPDSKAQYAKIASDYLNQMPTGLFRELMFEQLAKELRVYIGDLATLQKKPSHQEKPITREPLKNPAQIAIALLLKQPKLWQECPPATLNALLSLPNVTLLQKLINFFQKKQNVTVGEIINMCEDADEQREIAKLAALSYPFPSEGMLAEFNGAISRLKEIHLERFTNQLIKKSKYQELSESEKKTLSNLLTARHKNII